MKLKIKFPEYNKESDIQPYFVSSKQLSTQESEKKLDALNTLCGLIKLEELGYRDRQQNKLISIKKEADCLTIKIDDKCISVDE